MSTLGAQADTVASYDIDETALLVSTWVFTLTWVICGMQVLTYWNNKSKDHPVLQATVLALFINETIWTIMRCIALRQQLLIVKPGSLESFGLPKLQTISCYFANVTLLGVNLFLIYRYNRLTTRWWLSLPLAIAACVSLACHFWTNTIGVRVTDLITRPSIDLVVLFNTVDAVMRSARIASAFEFAVVAVTYLLLLAELISYSRKSLLGGKQILKRLIFITLESGLVTFALAAALVAMSWSYPAPSTFNILMACCARAYYHTMLFNLNMRHSGGLVMRDSEAGLSHLSSALRTRDGDNNSTLQATPLQTVSVSYHTQIATDYSDDKNAPYPGAVRGI